MRVRSESCNPLKANFLLPLVESHFLRCMIVMSGYLCFYKGTSSGKHTKLKQVCVSEYWKEEKPFDVIFRLLK